MALETLSYKVDSDVVHQEDADRQSRDDVVIKSGAAAIMEVGTVLSIEGRWLNSAYHSERPGQDARQSIFSKRKSR